MGFKDLYCFNIAMLAKQAWRILQHPNALWVRVLKSLYFPHSSFFEARKGSHPSWVWSSILKGRDIVQLGARWNVGNGQDILVYQDKWIPTLPGFQVTTVPDTNSLFSYVCELLDHHGEWDITKLHDCFNDEDCREILKIPMGECADQLVWHYDKYGRFTVKSAYLLTLQVVHEPSMHSDSTILTSSEWKQLWKLKIPPKIRVFIWRAILNALPSLDNLVRRGIAQAALCPCCHLADESIMHLLFYCPYVEPIWFGSAVGLHPRQLGANCFAEWWRYVKHAAKQMQNPSLVEYCAIISWQVWKTRNEKLFEHADISPHQVLGRIHAMTQEYFSSSKTDVLAAPSRPQPTITQNQSTWSRPPIGTYKINTDASFTPNSGAAALALVARDASGDICFGKTWSCMASTPLMAEAAAILKAVKLVEDMGLQEVIFESDNQTLISCIQQPTKPVPWEVNSSLLYIRQSCSTHPGFRFSYVSRDGNRVADWVARAVLQGRCPSYWAHRPPNILLNLLREDVNST
ncbi:hypothetical protein SLA2020_092720 [Shorea laevis]